MIISEIEVKTVAAGRQVLLCEPWYSVVMFRTWRRDLW